MAEVGKIVGENGTDDCVSGYDWLHGCERGVGLGMLLIICWKKDQRPYLCDTL